MQLTSKCETVVSFPFEEVNATLRMTFPSRGQHWTLPCGGSFVILVYRTYLNTQSSLG